MKNITYFPFERNHYYYGKLLTVDDFELEQRYSNNKRRMINRFLHGSGVVSGMNIVGIDDQTISLERGFALDFLGREIVVEKPTTKKLFDVDGFDTYKEENQAYTYLCIEYAEGEKEIVHNVAGGNAAEGAGVFNKYKESYRLYLSCEEPESLYGLSLKETHRERSTVYWANGIRIIQSMPRFIQSGETFELEIEIENMGQQGDFAFTYEVGLMFIKYLDRPELKIDFDERLVKKSSRYQMKYQLTALESDNVMAEANVRSESFRLTVDGRRVKEAEKGEIKGKSKTYLVGDKVLEHMVENHYKSDMENILNNFCKPCIYLAKIALIKAGNAYVIGEIENMPFHQYVWNSNLSFAANQLLVKEVKDLKEQFIKSGKKQKKNPCEESSGENKEVCFGTVELALEKSRRKGTKVFSEEIEHGMGIGKVCVSLGLERQEGEVIYGWSSVFEQKELPMQMAAKVNIEKGTFVIGAKLLETTNRESCKIHWTAWKDTESEEDSSEKRIMINPSMKSMSVRETCYLEAVCKNMNDRRVKWEVEKQGGIIDKNGMYTAPDKQGVYEVTVSSLVYPNVEASIFIIVKEKEEKKS